HRASRWLLVRTALHARGRDVPRSAAALQRRGRSALCLLAPDTGGGMTIAPTPALEVTSLVRSFRRPDGRVVRAVDEVSFDLKPGEPRGLVGESGCGKSSLARALMQLPPPESGSVRISGEEITGLSPAERRALRRRLQMVFQDPISSLNPRRRIGEI